MHGYTDSLSLLLTEINKLFEPALDLKIKYKSEILSKEHFNGLINKLYSDLIRPIENIWLKKLRLFSAEAKLKDTRHMIEHKLFYKM